MEGNDEVQQIVLYLARHLKRLTAGSLFKKRNELFELVEYQDRDTIAAGLTGELFAEFTNRQYVAAGSVILK